MGDGTFRETGVGAGVADPGWDIPKWSMGAAFGDYDNDGDLDLFVANFVKFDIKTAPPPPSSDGPCKLKGVAIVCAPDYFGGQQDLLYRNNGDGTFSDVSRATGIVEKDSGRGFAVAFSDFDDDGDQDIYVANDSGPNFLYENLGKNAFADQTASLGLEPIGFPYSGWGTKFADVSAAAGIRRLNNWVGRGAAFGDYDNDGDIDILVINKNDLPFFLENEGAKRRRQLDHFAGGRNEEQSQRTGSTGPGDGRGDAAGI